jgi:hypothetical protein
MFTAIIPGPKLPSEDQLNHFLCPLVYAICQTFYCGLRFPCTPKFPNGRVARSIVGPVVCDLPARCKIGGFASYSTTKYYCPCCSFSDKQYGTPDHPALNPEVELCGVSSLDAPKPNTDTKYDYLEMLQNDDGSSDPPSDLAAILRLEDKKELCEALNPRKLREPEDHSITPSSAAALPCTAGKVTSGWEPRSVHDLRLQAFAYNGVDSPEKRSRIFTTFSVRFTELYRLPPRWNPHAQLVVDGMHCWVEGVVQNHFRHVLQISEEHMKAKSESKDSNTESKSKSKSNWQQKQPPAFSLADMDVVDSNFDNAVITLNKSANTGKYRNQAAKVLEVLTRARDDTPESRLELSKGLKPQANVVLFLIAKKLGLISEGTPFMDYKRSKSKLQELLVNWVRLPDPREAKLTVC